MKKLYLVGLVLLIVALMTGATTGLARENRDWIEYRIRRGDTIWGISEKILRKETWTVINKVVEKNGIKDPDLIYAGDTILIPRSVRVILEKPSQLEQRVTQLERKTAGLERLPGDFKEVGILIAEAIKYQAEKVKNLIARVKGIEEVESQLIKTFDRIEASVNRIRTQGWSVIGVVGAGLIIFLIVSLLILRRYYIIKLKKAEEERQRLEKGIEQIQQQLTQRVAELVEKLTKLTTDLQKSIQSIQGVGGSIGGSIRVKAKKADREVEKDCKIVRMELTEKGVRRKLECPYCGTSIWADNMPGHWEVCKKGPFPKPKK